MTESTNQTRRPIGIMDSGIGGLAIYRALRQQLPNEDFIYFADSRYCPYGSRTNEEIEARVSRVATYLVELDVKAIVIACNTATVRAVSSLRAVHGVPIFGIEPGIKPASLVSNTRKVLLLATPKTLESNSVARLQESHGVDLEIISQPCPGLVERVEAGDLAGKITHELLHQFLLPVETSNADVVILGCSHFIFLEPLVRSIVGPAIEILEPSRAVALQVGRRLEDQLLNAGTFPEAGDKFFTSSAIPETVSAVASQLLGRDVQFIATENQIQSSAA